jgi:CO dehydrogenase/acetyl-CoA synthase alpha subunit
MKINLSIADLEHGNVQVRFRSLSRRKTTCKGCRRARVVCSKRLGVCQICFHAEVLRVKGIT